ncbi:hypothetical protein Tco_0309472 [Tanacetum coccineum]
MAAQGTAIQANMDVKDADYFNQLMQNHRAYQISGFSCEQTSHWERTLQNHTPLIFGRFIDLQEISNALLRGLEKKLPPVLQVTIRHYLIEIVLTGDRSKGKHFLTNESMQGAISIDETMIRKQPEAMRNGNKKKINYVDSTIDEMNEQSENLKQIQEPDTTPLWHPRITIDARKSV